MYKTKNIYTYIYIYTYTYMYIFFMYIHLLKTKKRNNGIRRTWAPFCPVLSPTRVMRVFAGMIWEGW